MVLGAGGFLGAQVVRRAVRAGDGVRWPTVLAAARRELPAGVRSAGATFLGWSAEQDVGALLDGARPDVVVNAAALSRVGECERDPELARALNAELPERLATACAARAVRFLHVSTDLVFGRVPPPGGGFPEEAPPAPVQRYGASKAQGEARVLAASEAALVVRLPLLHGDSLGRSLGASDALLDALDRGETPTLFEDEWRTPLDVEVAAEALLELAGLEVTGLLHVAGAERLSRFDLARRVLAANGDARVDRLRRGRRVDFGWESERPEDCSLDASRARERLATLARLDRGAQRG